MPQQHFGSTSTRASSAVAHSLHSLNEHTARADSEARADRQTPYLRVMEASPMSVMGADACLHDVVPL